MSDKKSYRTTWDAEVAQVYRPTNPTVQQSRADLGEPGHYPFTRGIHPHMYRHRMWTMRQYAGYSDAAQSNARYRYLLAQGQTGLSVAFDLPTQIGLDSDHSLSEGEVGKVGVAIDSLEDMEILLQGIPLEKTSTSMTINATAAILLAMYIAVSKNQGVPGHKLRGTTQNDILKEYVARGTYIFPLEPSLRLVVDLMQYCAAELPEWNTISVSGYHIREAGSTAVQEVAFTLANAITYIEWSIRRGLEPDTMAPRISFFFNSHNNVLEDVAKFRAARRMWARIMKERFGALSPRSWMLRFHTQTAGSTLTAQQPQNNLVRTTLQALAAVLGGTQSLHTNAMDEALSLPTEKAALLALRTQQILAHESGVANTVDPLGGSYYVEWLTNTIETESRKYLDRIEKMGGMLRAIEEGFIQGEIQQAAYRYQKQLEEREQKAVGVNMFTDEESEKIPTLRIDPRFEQSQKERLRDLRARRDPERWARSLQELEQCARGPANLLPPILKCVEAYATVGEIATCLRTVFGQYQERKS